MRMRSAQAKIAGAANLPRPPSKDPHLMEVLLWHKGMMSLVAGGGSGGVMFLLAMYNMGQFKKGRVAFEATWVNLVLSGGICHAMVQRWMETGAVFPSAVVAALAGGMAVFYALVLAFPPKVHAKKTE
mmetsp:Transcript_29745/g.95657  ORF Transcript_29745/g.95657 Transcript_29745/m.95657 type:complete len:128 (+) Transcript_29745:1217-1600(+)